MRIFVLAPLAALAFAGCRAAPDPGFDRALVAAALVPAARGEAARHADVPFYRIDARLDPDRRAIAGALRVAVVDATPRAWPTIWFRLQPNAPQYDDGALTVADVTVDGAPATTRLLQGDTTLAVDLPRPLRPGRRAVVAMRFTATVPEREHGFGIYRAGPRVWNLYGWHPTLAPIDGGDWVLPDIPPLAEPTDTACADYLVDLRAPAAWTVVATGDDAVADAGDGERRWTFRAALARNLVVCAGPDLQRVETTVGATVVAAYAPAADAASAIVARDTAAQALPLYADAFGPYPWRELDLVCTDLGPHAGGMEASGLIMVDRAMAASPRVFAAMVTAHEVAHQWFYGLVGSDSIAAPWLDESLASWADAWFLERAFSPFVAAQALRVTAELPYRQAVAKGGEQPIGQAAAALDESALGAFVYGKGALMYARVRRDLGDERFFAFLGRYARDQRFGRADRAAWRAALAAAAGDVYADAALARWIDGAEPLVDDPPSER